METPVVCLLIILSFQLMTYPEVVSLFNHQEHSIADIENSVHGINWVDNDPEFLVGVKGLPKPLCFHMEGPANDVIRLIQDPVSDVVVNARIVHQGPANKSYLGAIMVSQGPTFKILAKQRGLVIADQKYDWTVPAATTVDGHRIFLEKDTVAVTFRNVSITLVLRRHVSVRGESDDEDEVSASTQSDIDDDVDDNERRIDDSTVTDGDDDEGEGDDDANNLVKDSGEIPEDRFEEGDPGYRLHAGRADIIKSQPRRKRYMAKASDITSSSNSIDTAFKTSKSHFMLRRNGDPGAFETRKLKRVRDHYHENDVLRHQHSRKRKGLSRTWRTHRGAGSEHLVIPKDQSEHTNKEEEEGGGEKKKEKVLFLGIYISDSTDFSNKTHGLLGQFLHKKVKLERIQVKNGQMKARIRIDGEEPERRFKAMLKLRTNAALNTKRACWRVRHHGRDVIDGNYPDYLVPSLRYSLMKELPPSAPI